MRNLVLVGGGGHAKSCIDVIEGLNEYKIIGILDTPDKVGQKILDYEIIGTDNDIKKYTEQDAYFLVTVGQIESADLRKTLYEKIKFAGGKVATIVSKRAYVSKYANIGEGTIVMHGAIINAGANVGRNCIVNTNALIEHDCSIGNHCHIAVSAVLAGGVTLEEESFIGANATVVQCLHLPQKSFVKAGSIEK